MACDLNVLAVASTEAAVAMVPDLAVVVLVLDDIHFACHLHSAYVPVEDNPLVVVAVGAAVAGHHASHRVFHFAFPAAAVSSWFAFGFGS